MTEDEAKTKWCPFARVVIGDSDEPAIGPFNRDHWINDDNLENSIHRSTCLGSACMAWRQHRHGPVLKLKTGYCGLAGKL